MRSTRAGVVSGIPTDMMTVVGVGCDVHYVAQVAQGIEVFGEKYLERVFTSAERADCVGGNVAERLAGRFAVKEAVFKAMRIPRDVAIPWPTIEVRTAPDRAPYVLLHGTAAQRAADLGITRFEVSISHETGVALGFAVAVADSRLQVSA